MMSGPSKPGSNPFCDECSNDCACPLVIPTQAGIEVLQSIACPLSRHDRLDLRVRTAKMAKRKGGQTLENKRSREIIDSGHVVMSTTCHERCETFRFAWQNDTPAFAGFAFRRRWENEMDLASIRPRPERPRQRGAPRRSDGIRVSARGIRKTLPSTSLRAGFRGHFAAPQTNPWRDPKPQKVARKRSQAPEIVGSRNFVRAPVRAFTARSWRWGRPRPAPGRLRAQGRPSRSARGSRDLRPSPGVRPARASARH